MSQHATKNLRTDRAHRLWTHERHTRRVVEISEALGVVFSVADDQTVRAIQATSGEELWCSRWAWGRHGPPPERGSQGFMSKAVNFVVGQRSFL